MSGERVDITTQDGVADEYLARPDDDPHPAVLLIMDAYGLRPQIEAMADPTKAPYAGLPSIEEAVKGGAFLCGPAEQIIEQLMKLEEAYPGLERINVAHPVGTPQSIILEQLQQFAEEVMPAFTNRVTETVVGD